jgi:hypothetical protein
MHRALCDGVGCEHTILTLHTEVHWLPRVKVLIRELNFETYEGELVNRSYMDIKRKTCDTRIWKKHLFLNISSVSVDTLVPSLYEGVETRSIEVF